MTNYNNIAPLSENRNPWTSFFVLLLFVFIGLFVGQFLGLLTMLPWIDIAKLTEANALSKIMANPLYRQPVMVMNSCVALCAFIVAPLVYLYVYEKKRLTIFFNNNHIISIPLLLTIFIVLAFMSVNSIFIEWNANLDLPDFLQPFESWAKRMEEQVQELTVMMTRFSGPGDFIFAIIVIGLIPAIGEELLFRGFVQNQLFGITRNIHVAIWVGGLLFSAFHLQFYGLVPRMFLGVLFGYLYYWSGNLFIAMLGHFINNTFTLLLLYLYQQEIITYDIENTTTIPVANVIFSLVLGVIFIILFKKYFAKRVKHYG